MDHCDFGINDKLPLGSSEILLFELYGSISGCLPPATPPNSDVPQSKRHHFPVGQQLFSAPGV